MEKQKIVLFGGGGGAVEIARYITQMDTDPATGAKLEVSDLLDEGIGRVADLEHVTQNSIRAHNDISTIQNLEQKKFVITLGHTPLRDEKYVMLKENGAKFFTVIHPTAHVVETSVLGEGSIISPYCLIGEFVQMEDNVFLNVRCTIGHDVVLGRSSVFSPNTVLSGAVKCGKSVFTGAAASINPGLSVGDYVKLSSGSVVNKDVAAGKFVFGNPAKTTKMFSPETGKSLFAS